jgi:hypothetical protein
MKVARFLFLILILTMSSAALMPGTGYASPSQQTSAESSANTASAGNPSDEQRDPCHGSDKNHPCRRARLTVANYPERPPKLQKRSTPGSAVYLHRPGSGKAGAAAKSGLIQNETASNAMLVRLPGTGRPPAPSLNPSLNNVRHRGPNAAVVGGSAGGSANLNCSNTGAINGTRMHRKP